MGVVYLLAYVLGAVSTAFGYRNLIDDVLDGEDPLQNWGLLAFGATTIALAALLHAITERRLRTENPLPQGTPVSRGFVAVAVALWLGPLVVSWLQFEAFVDPIHMFPVATVVGSLGVVYALARSAFAAMQLRRVALLVAFAAVGLPVGMLTVGLPMAHFRHHLSGVAIVVWGTRTTPPKTDILEAESPEPEEIPVVGAGTLELINALANAVPVEVDVAEEIAAGRMRREEDGSITILGDDGQPQGDVFGRLQEEAKREDDAAREIAHAEYRERVRRQRLGGRLFSSPDDASAP